ncbi:hypothetical protein G7Y89_g7319 [Cudoniella acicularis]|uniref:Uncharacterized protein n=1 Tax=Cudoniella acicularis TaxID=354080 RepID=A0A8H4RIP9_9HELO|nr:hypothetical protein G7Y89_g7319 [Cudoniella acicularis]
MALDVAGLEVKDLDSVILRGDAIRTPFVQKELEKFVSAKDSKDSKDSKDAKPKVTKRFEVIPLKYTAEIKGLPQLLVSEITWTKDRIAAFDDSDRSRRLRKEALNQLEGFTYKVRGLLDNEEFVAASTTEERATLEAKSKAASDWIYPSGAEASREELKAKLKEMKDVVGPIESRKKEPRPDRSS